MSFWNPRLPKFVQSGRICEIRQVNQDLQELSPIGSDCCQPTIDLCQDLCRLAASILCRIVGNLDKIGCFTVNHDVRPSFCHSESLNIRHEKPFAGKLNRVEYNDP